MKSDRRSFLAVSGIGAIAGLAPRTSAATTVIAHVTGSRLALTPQVTEGPFYLALGLPRSDITEGRPGVPLEVRIRVVDVRGQPLPGARVDLWHCDASGLYSRFDGQAADRTVTMRGRTFLRGTMRGGNDGVATFRTIYPGWYAGRTTHIHLKVFYDDHVILTSQIFLPDALSEYLFTSVPDYRRATLRDTLNRRDGIALEAGDAAFGDVREAGDRYVVTATTVVDPAARPPAERPPGPPGVPGPRPGDGPPDRAGVRPHVDVGNRGGGGTRGSVGLGDGRGGPRGPGGGPPPDGPPPMGEGPTHAVLQGDARVAAIVPGRTPR